MGCENLADIYCNFEENDSKLSGSWNLGLDASTVTVHWISSGICDKCTDGKIIGYKCDTTDCDVISSTLSDTEYSYKCQNCGTSDTAQPEEDGNGRCSNCRTEVTLTLESVLLPDCGHFVDFFPQQMSYPCPDCSGE